MNYFKTAPLTNDVQTAFDDLLKCTGYLTEHNRGFLISAFWFSYNAHIRQFRASKEPYILHPITVCCKLAEFHMDVYGLAAALLHDTVEDNPDITHQHIDEHFGSVVRLLVDSVTKLEKFDARAELKYEGENPNLRERQAGNLQYLLVNSAKDVRALVIKLADRMHNMETLGNLRLEKQQRIADETMKVYAPLASMLGMWQWKSLLENMAFKILEPSICNNIEAKIDDLLHGANQEKIDALCIDFREHLNKANIKVREVYGRIKTPYSIWRKSKNKNLRFSKLMDIVAFRLVLEHKRDCYSALRVMHSHYGYLQNSLDDYVSVPKGNGYMSLHTVVMLGDHIALDDKKRAEIQIRSKAMHKVAETGIAAHWRYKDGSSLSSELSLILDTLKKAHDEKTLSPLVMSEFSLDSLSKEVVSYTPKGHMVRLQDDATVLDFAFHVHSEVGLKFKEALVNGSNVTMGYCMKQGDQVEILTSEESHPEAFWKLNAKTQRASSAIQLAINNESLKYFEKFILNLAREFDVAIVAQIDVHAMKRVFSAIAVENVPQLEDKMLKGLVSPRDILHATQPNLKIKPLPKLAGVTKHTTVTTSHMPIFVKQCHLCFPIPGDEMFGVMILDKGLVAHRRYCSLLKSYNRDEILPNVQLNNPVSEAEKEYCVILDCIMTNRPGMLGVIASAIGERGINVHNIDFLSRDPDCYIIRCTLFMQHNGQMDGIEKTIRSRASDSIEIKRPYLDAPIIILDGDED